MVLLNKNVMKTKRDYFLSIPLFLRPSFPQSYLTPFVLWMMFSNLLSVLDLAKMYLTAKLLQIEKLGSTY